MTELEKAPLYTSTQIQELIPHRYPFFFLDRVIEFVDNERVVCIKNVTANEEFFEGHFPGKPVMPGVVILEAMAQAAAVLSRLSTNGIAPEKSIYLVGADNFRWKRLVTPGDTLRIEMRFIKKRGPLWILTGETTVDGALCCGGTITAAEV